MSNQLLWKPNQQTIEHSHMHHFIRAVNKQFSLRIKNYEELYQWSIDQPALFWKAIADFSKIIFSDEPTTIMQSEKEMWKTKWFVDAKLNFAENCLWRRDDHIALIYENENGDCDKITYAELYSKAFSLAEKLKLLGLKPSDRVAAFVANRIETVIAMLATTLLGGIWTSCGVELKVNAVIERFSQIQPTILFVVKEHYYDGKYFSHQETIQQLQEQLPSVKNIIVLEELDFTSTHISTPTYFPFDHPLYILYSSGTTGKPKCMVHGAGNTLIQHKKELLLHIDAQQNDTLLFYTSCSWMMWHWMISTLSVGATILLYESSPFYSKTILLDLVNKWDVSIFGCGAKIFETYLKSNIDFKKTHHLKKLKTIVPTGSPLIAESFHYIYKNIKQDVRVSTISGGSDIISCFAIGNPILPVYCEEMQCIGLGMKVEIFDPDGKSIKNEPGELVCTQPFPSMPIYFWNDPNDEKYSHAYFDQFPNVWTHGDFAKITEHNGFIIYGRSDATLNPGGVRIGTTDIYTQVLKIPEIIDCIAVGKQNNGDEDIILFVVLIKDLKLDEIIMNQIKTIIRENTSPYHVPKKIIQVADIPKTMNGKTMEIAVKNIINGREIKNVEVLANPESLNQFKNLHLI